MRFEYAPGATLIDLDEAKGLIPAHLTLQRELNEYEESNILEATAWLFARRRGDPLDERFIHVVHGRMFNQTWKWAGKSRRTDKNIGVSWFEIPVRLRQMLGDVRAQIEHQAYSPIEIAARYENCTNLLYSGVANSDSQNLILYFGLTGGQWIRKTSY